MVQDFTHRKLYHSVIVYICPRNGCRVRANRNMGGIHSGKEFVERRAAMGRQEHLGVNYGRRR